MTLHLWSTMKTNNGSIWQFFVSINADLFQQFFVQMEAAKIRPWPQSPRIWHMHPQEGRSVAGWSMPMLQCGYSSAPSQLNLHVYRNLYVVPACRKGHDWAQTYTRKHEGIRPTTEVHDHFTFLLLRSPVYNDYCIEFKNVHFSSHL